MFTCLPCSKSLENEENGNSHLRTKTLTSQMKELAGKAKGAYRNSKPSKKLVHSEEFQYSYRRPEDISSISSPNEGSTPSRSGKIEPVASSEGDETKEWQAQVEPGVLITLMPLPRGGNELKRIRFSREIFNKWQAQQWWLENYDKVMELYNVRQSSISGNEVMKSINPGVYITIKVLRDGTRELVRVRFSRENFGESSARAWWDQNRERIQQRYL